MKVLIVLSILAVVAAVPQPELRRSVQNREDPSLEKAQSPTTEHAQDSQPEQAQDKQPEQAQDRQPEQAQDRQPEQAQDSQPEQAETNHNEVDDDNEDKEDNGDIKINIEDLIKAIERIKDFLNKGHNHKQVHKEKDDNNENHFSFERNPDSEANAEENDIIPANRPQEDDQEFSNILNNGYHVNSENNTPIPKRESVDSEFDDKITINSVLNKGDEIVLDNEITNVVPKTNDAVSHQEGIQDLGKVEPFITNTIRGEPQKNESDDEIESTEKSVDVTHDQENLSIVHHFRPSFLARPHRLPRPQFRVPILLD